MATNNVNNNYFSVAAYTNKGMSGMVSGLDTESMVRQMMLGTQKKIDKQMAVKQQTLWRQTIYRDIISSINSVRNKYFNTAYDASPLNNLSSAKFFNSKISTVTGSSAVKVLSTSPNANVGDLSIEVTQLAKAATLTSGVAIGASESIKAGNVINANSFDKVIQLFIGGSSASNELRIDLTGINDQAAMVDRINDTLSNEGYNDVSAKVYNNQLRIVNESGQSIRVGYGTTDLAIRMTGLYYNDVSEFVSGTGAVLFGGNQINPNAGHTVTVNIDGVEKQITLNPQFSMGDTAADKMEAVKDSLQAELDRAFGHYIDVTLNVDKLELAFSPAGFTDDLSRHSLTVFGASANNLGITPGSSNRLSTASRIGDIEGLTGERFSFEINGKKFSFTKDDTIGTMLNKVNTSGAGVTMSYSSVDSKFKITANTTGKQYKIEISQSEGDLLGTIFRTSAAPGGEMFNPGDTISSVLLTTNVIQGNPYDAAARFTGGAKFTLNVDGVDHTFTYGAIDQEYIAYDVVNALNDWLHASFGTTGSNANINYNLVTGELEINNGALVKFKQTAVDTENSSAMQAGAKLDIALALGFNNVDKSNVATGATSIDDIPRLQDLIAELNSIGPTGWSDPGSVTLDSFNDMPFDFGIGTATYADGRLVVKFSSNITLNEFDPNNTTGSGNGLYNQIVDLFGGSYDASGNFTVTVGDGQMVLGGPNTGGLNGSYIEDGSNAEVTINGVVTERSSNTFEIDGVTIQLVGLTNPMDGPTVITTQRDTEAVVEAFKSFVEDYNAMIDKLNGYLHADPLYREYTPLTDEQKKEMTAREIELWEENAKTGLIRNDMTVSNFLNNMFSTLYTKPLSSHYALYDIGIEATDYKQPGKLFLDEDKLRKALQNDPYSVENLFLDPDKGLAKQMSALMDGVARISLANPGSLVSLAGVENSITDRNNDLTRDINSINDRLKDLWDRYEREKARYWQQFNTMERILANYQAQSEWIYQNMVMSQIPQ